MRPAPFGAFELCYGQRSVAKLTVSVARSPALFTAITRAVTFTSSG